MFVANRIRKPRHLLRLVLSIKEKSGSIGFRFESDKRTFKTAESMPRRNESAGLDGLRLRIRPRKAYCANLVSIGIDEEERF